MSGFERLIGRLGYDQYGSALIRRDEQVRPDHPFAPEIRRMFTAVSAGPVEGVSAAAVFAVGEVPVVCLVDAAELSEDARHRQEALRRFFERLWNQNLVSVVLVLGPGMLEAYSVLDPKAERELVPSSHWSPSGQWSSSEILSGQAWERKEKWFDPGQRVDRTLLDSVAQLLDALGRNGMHRSVARDVIARVVFVMYLQHRGIVTDHYRRRHGVGELSHLVRQVDRPGLRELFGRLREDFNGDFLKAPEAVGHDLWDLPEKCLDLLSRFLDKTDLKTQQTSLWQYDFSEIPIELIAGIYETFLATKDVDVVQRDTGKAPSARQTQRELGAYYTPRHLALFVVEQAFAGVTEPLEQRVFDGACGSGILLTTVYRLLIRVAEQQSGRALSFGERQELLSRSIFGSDIDMDACRLTAFSLYLALLSDLEPPDLALIEEGGGRLPRLIGRNILCGPDKGDLFSLKRPSDEEPRYTMAISNPPWREPGKDEQTTFEPWLGSLSAPPEVPRRQIAAAFTFRVADYLESGSRLALILPAALFMGTGARGFRTSLLQMVQPQQIVNFSDMRRLVFPGARHPFVVLFGCIRPRDEPQWGGATEFFEYLVPKADISLAYGRFAVHADDRVRLPSSVLTEDEPVLGLRYWGTDHDISLLRRLRRYGKIGDLVSKQPAQDGRWCVNSGFLAEYKDSPALDIAWLGDYPFVEAGDLSIEAPFIDPQLVRKELPARLRSIAYYGVKALYAGPRVLWPDGISIKEGVKAVYVEEPMTFRHGVKAIGAGLSDERDLLMLLTAYLRSPLAQYLLILLSHSVSGERPKLHIHELRAMPFMRPEQHPHPEVAKRILREVEGIFVQLQAQEAFEWPDAYSRVKEKLDGLVFDYFCMDEEDRALVREMVYKVAPSIQPSSLDKKNLLNELLRAPQEEDFRSYCQALQSNLMAWQTPSGGQNSFAVHVEIDRGRALAGVVVRVGRVEPKTGGRQAQNVPIVEEDLTGELIRAVGQALKNRSAVEQGNLLMMPHITLFSGHSLCLVKPLRTRFWLRRSAMTDAERIVNVIQATYVSRRMGTRTGTAVDDQQIRG